jgi:hypothetical protein
MADSDAQEDAAKVASPTLAYLRSFDKKLDLVLQTLARHTERLGRVERDFGEVRRDLSEEGDIALLENKTLSAQSDILSVLQRNRPLRHPSNIRTTLRRPQGPPDSSHGQSWSPTSLSPSEPHSLGDTSRHCAIVPDEQGMDRPHPWARPTR